MNSKRLYFSLLGIVGLLFVSLLGGAYVINSVITSQAHTLTDLKAKTMAQALQQQSLNKAKKDIKKYTELHKIAQTIVPEDKNQAEAVREIVNIAKTNNVPLSSITFPSSTLGSTAVGGKAAAPAAGASTAPVVVNPKTAALSQLVAVKDVPGVYELTISIQNDISNAVTYNQLVDFLHDLEHNRRTAQVSSITITPTVDDPSYLVFKLSLTEYIKP